MQQDILEAAIRKAGSQTQLAKVIGFSQNAVWYAAKKRGGKVSPLMAARIDEWSNGEFPREKLRPDVFGPASTRTETPERAA